MGAKSKLTAAEQILLAAADLTLDGKREFSEWDLTVAVWKRDVNKFGCRGYEKEYPDHKRVMMEIMGAKTANPLRKGWMEKTKKNHYHITGLGMAEAQRLRGEAASSEETAESSARLYDDIERYAFHGAFRAYQRDNEEPKSWLGASAFLGITKNEPEILQDKLAKARNTIVAVLRYLEETGQDTMRRGPVGGGSKTIPREQVVQMQEFLEVIQERFSVQIRAIMQKARA